MESKEGEGSGRNRRESRTRDSVRREETGIGGITRDRRRTAVNKGQFGAREWEGIRFKRIIKVIRTGKGNRGEKDRQWRRGLK